MQLTFAIFGDFDVQNQSYSARISRVETAAGEDITAHFFKFAADSNMSLDSEDQIRLAANAYARKFHA